MKTPEELNALKKEFESLNRKLAELTEEELRQVTGGVSASLNETNDYWDRVWCDRCLTFVMPKDGACPNCGQVIR